MLSSLLRYVLVAAALAHGSLAASGSQVPSDLSGSFDPITISLEVDYSTNTITDGQTLNEKDVQNEPTFGLGDGSGINTAAKFVIVMVDTTSSKRVIHYVRGDFASDGTETRISSSSQPVMAYKAPGTLLDTGARQYSWLLYRQIGSIQASSLPSAGQTIDMTSFQSANGLKAPLAGLQMRVSVAGAAAASPSTQQTAASSTLQVAQQSQAAQTTSTASTATQQASPSTSMSAATMTTQSTSPQATSQQPDTAAATTPTVFSTSTVPQTTISMNVFTSSTAAASASSSGGNSTISASGAASIAPWALPLLIPLAILVPLSF